MLYNRALTPIIGNAIRPRGWLRRQLEIQAAGLSGNLDKIWPDVRDSLRACGPVETVEMIPYGCTNLRMTEMPVAVE